MRGRKEFGGGEGDRKVPFVFLVSVQVTGDLR